MNDLAGRISDAELEVMKVLWEARRELPVTVIREKLQERKGWEPTTIKTLVSRLAGKGVISQEKCGVFYYRPLVTEQEYNEKCSGWRNKTMRILLALTASGSLLALLLLLLKALLGKKLSSTMYYYLWLLVLLRFVLPLPGLVPLGRQVQDTPVQTNRTVMQRPPLPELREERDSGRNYEEFWLSTMEQAGGQEAVSPAEPAKKAVSIDWKAPALWLSLWAAGAAGSLGFYVISYTRFRIRMRKSLLPPRESDLAVYNGFAGRKPELQRCKGLHTPILCGVLHPMLILPDRDYEDDVLRNILHHELTHYRRMDTLYKWFAVPDAPGARPGL